MQLKCWHSQPGLIERRPVGAQHIACRCAGRRQQVACLRGVDAGLLDAFERIDRHKAGWRDRARHRGRAAARPAIQAEQQPHCPAQAIGQRERAQQHVVRAGLNHR
jgi:hypothetical protein